MPEYTDVDYIIYSLIAQKMTLGVYVESALTFLLRYIELRSHGMIPIGYQYIVVPRTFFSDFTPTSPLRAA